MTNAYFSVMMADIDDILTDAGIPGDMSTLRRVKELVARYHEAQAETQREKLGAEYANQRVRELYAEMEAQRKRILGLRRELEKYSPAGEVQQTLFEATP